MKDIPLLMTGPLVLKALAGEKTQTRRLSFRGIRGDRIWVKETLMGGSQAALRYAADSSYVDGNKGPDGWRWKWRRTYAQKMPSIYMPKWACRLWLEVLDVRTEPLHDITEADAAAEGVDCHTSRLEHFQRLWDGINYDRAPWATNPTVHVITFRRIEAP